MAQWERVRLLRQETQGFDDMGLKHGFDPWVGKISWRRKWQPTPVFLPGESHGQRSLESSSPQGLKRVRHDGATEHVHMHIPFIVTDMEFVGFFCIKSQSLSLHQPDPRGQP